MKKAAKKKIEFSKLEIKIIQMLCKEMSNAEIADKLGYSARTIEGYRNDITNAIGARNVIGILIYALKHDIVRLK
jgi:DNA-binding NarL/FixJ family response regulator